MQKGAGGGCPAWRGSLPPKRSAVSPGTLPPGPAPGPRTLALASASFKNILSHYDLSRLLRMKAQKSLEGVWRVRGSRTSGQAWFLSGPCFSAQSGRPDAASLECFSIQWGSTWEPSRGLAPGQAPGTGGLSCHQGPAGLGHSGPHRPLALMGQLLGALWSVVSCTAGW